MRKRRAIDLIQRKQWSEEDREAYRALRETVVKYVGKLNEAPELAAATDFVRLAAIVDGLRLAIFASVTSDFIGLLDGQFSPAYAKKLIDEFPHMFSARIPRRDRALCRCFIAMAAIQAKMRRR